MIMFEIGSARTTCRTTQIFLFWDCEGAHDQPDYSDNLFWDWEGAHDLPDYSQNTTTHPPTCSFSYWRRWVASAASIQCALSTHVPHELNPHSRHGKRGCFWYVRTFASDTSIQLCSRHALWHVTRLAHLQTAARIQGVTRALQAIIIAIIIDIKRTATTTGAEAIRKCASTRYDHAVRTSCWSRIGTTLSDLPILAKCTTIKMKPQFSGSIPGINNPDYHLFLTLNLGYIHHPPRPQFQCCVFWFATGGIQISMLLFF